MHVLLSGATGFVGRALHRHLQSQGYTVTALSRKPPAHDGRGGEPAFLQWNPAEGLSKEQLTALGAVNAVIHLAGEPIAARRWSAEQKRRISASRIDYTRRLVDDLAAMPSPPTTFISASAVGFYGDRGDEELTEASAPGTGFLTDVCRGWEAEARRAEEAGMRSVQLRIGMVVGAGGGALSRMLLPFRLGLGGRLGSGRQWMSWIHRDDLVRLIAFALDGASDLKGPVNATAPKPVRNIRFTAALGRALRRPTMFPVPAAALRIAFGEMACVLLDSQRVLPRLALSAGFTFTYPDVEQALRASVSAQG